MKKFELEQTIYLADGLVGEYIGFIPEQNKHVIGIINNYEEGFPTDKVFYSYRLCSDSEIFSDENEIIFLTNKKIERTKETLAETLKDLSEARNEHFQLQQEIAELRNVKSDLKKLIVNKSELLKGELWFWRPDIIGPWKGVVSSIEIKLYPHRKEDTHIWMYKSKEYLEFVNGVRAYRVDPDYPLLLAEGTTEEEIIKITKERASKGEWMDYVIEDTNDLWLPEELLLRKRKLVAAKKIKRKKEKEKQKEKLEKELAKLENDDEEL